MKRRILLLPILFIYTFSFAKPRASDRFIDAQEALKVATEQVGLDSIQQSSDSISVRLTLQYIDEMEIYIYDLRYIRDNASALAYRIFIDEVTENTLLKFFRPKTFYIPRFAIAEMQPYESINDIIPLIPRLSAAQKEPTFEPKCPKIEMLSNGTFRTFQCDECYRCPQADSLQTFFERNFYYSF